jgi:hypothetical protein
MSSAGVLLVAADDPPLSARSRGGRATQDGSELTESVIVIGKVLGALLGCRHTLGGFGTFSVTASKDLLLKER